MADDAPEGEQEPLDYLHDLADVLAEPSPPRLRDLIEQFALEGVQHGAVVLDAETGLARVSTPDPTHVSERLGWLDDVQTALSTAAGQLAALGALDAVLVEAPGLERLNARELRDEIAVVAAGHAPSRVLDRIGPLLRREDRILPGTSVGLWFRVLVVVFQMPLLGRTRRECVEHILKLLCATVGDVPPALREPNADDMDRATQFVERIAGHVRTEARWSEPTELPEYKPTTRGRGRPYDPWTAAAKFAECFGIRQCEGHAIPERGRDAKRRKRK